MVVQAILVESAIVALGSVTQAIGDAVGALDAAQKDSFAVGLTFREAKSQFSQDFKGLRGTIETKFAGSMELLHAGLQGNTGSIAKLVNQQKLTGQSTEGTGKLMVALETQLGLSRAETSNLSENILYNANKYGVTSESLVRAMLSLESSFATLNVAGVNGAVLEAINTVQSMVPMNKKQFTSFINLLTDTSQSGLDKVAKLGILGKRQEMFSATTTRDAIEDLFEILGIASGRWMSVVEGSTDKMIGQYGATANFGIEGQDATILLRQIGKRLEKGGDFDYGAGFANKIAEWANVAQDIAYNAIPGQEPAFTNTQTQTHAPRVLESPQSNALGSVPPPAGLTYEEALAALNVTPKVAPAFTNTQTQPDAYRLMEDTKNNALGNVVGRSKDPNTQVLEDIRDSLRRAEEASMEKAEDLNSLKFERYKTSNSNE